MTDFPRTVSPESVSAFWSPGNIKAFTLTGAAQIRSIRSAGWVWEEKWGLLSTLDINDIALMTFIKKAWNRGEIFDITHPLRPGSGRPPNGLGTAGVLVKGASQSGASLITDAWPLSTSNCVRIGDVIKVVGDNAVYVVSGDANSDGLGDVTIPVNPPLRKSPSDNAAVTTTGVKFRSTIISRSRYVESRSFAYYGDYSVVFAEALL